jgi:alanyl-tRNA synthetase
MEAQRERSRAAGGFEVGLAGERPTEFVGYEKTDVLTAISALEAREDGLFDAKLHESPFYPEGGGQVSDTGWIEHEETGARAELVRATRVGDDQVLTFRGEGFAVGDRVRAVVPWSHRFPTMANHTATHLLHEALREVLGTHVKQAGSAVRPDKLRFDFTHQEAMTSDERRRVEEIVNRKIFENLPVRWFVTPIEEARKLGAMMLFGEKYGDEVRVIEIAGFSTELCGGTHVRWTAEIGPFVIVSESSVGAGARRIEAVTSGEAYALLHGRAHEADELRAEHERIRREQRKQPAAVAAEDELDVRYEDASVAVIEVKQSATPLRDLSDRIRRQRKVGAVLLGARVDGRVQLVLSIDKGLVERGLDAGRVIREIAQVVGGGGGGRADFAEAGGRKPEKLGDALDAGQELLVAALS